MIFCKKIYSLEELPELARQLIGFAGDQKIWILSGEMGAGKTTLSKALCHALGVRGSVSSPTFSIVNEYETDQGETIYHFDFYRLKEPEEALGIGVEEYFDSGNICLLEWASKIAPFVPESFLLISLVAKEDGSREVRAQRY